MRRSAGSSHHDLNPKPQTLMHTPAHTAPAPPARRWSNSRGSSTSGRWRPCRRESGEGAKALGAWLSAPQTRMPLDRGGPRKGTRNRSPCPSTSAALAPASSTSSSSTSTHGRPPPPPPPRTQPQMTLPRRPMHEQALCCQMREEALRISNVWGSPPHPRATHSSYAAASVSYLLIFHFARTCESSSGALESSTDESSLRLALSSSL